MRRTLAPVAALALAVGCANTPEFEPGELPVSLVQLLTHPERVVSGQPIAVYGFLATSMGMSLYLTKDLAVAEDTGSAIPITEASDDGQLLRSGCDGQFVRVHGRFGSRSGASYISDVSLIEVPPAVYPRVKFPDDYVLKTCFRR